MRVFEFLQEKREEGKTSESVSRRELISTLSSEPSPVSQIAHEGGYDHEFSNNKDNRENIRIWKVLSKTLRPLSKHDSHHHHHHAQLLQARPLDEENNEKHNNTETTIFSWSRRHLLKSPWKLYHYPRSRYPRYQHNQHHHHAQNNHHHETKDRI